MDNKKREKPIRQPKRINSFINPKNQNQFSYCEPDDSDHKKIMRLKMLLDDVSTSTRWGNADVLIQNWTQKDRSQRIFYSFSEPCGKRSQEKW